MKRLTVVMLTILIIAVASTVTYAWLTYVQIKSLSTVETHEISILLHADETQVFDQIQFDNLAFIDYEKDLIQNETNTFDAMASTWILTLGTSEESPLTKSHLEFEQNQPGLIYLLIYYSWNGEIVPQAASLFDLINTIIDGYETKEEQLDAITAYNQSVADLIDLLVFFPSDYVQIKVSAWGDYDSLIEPSNYHNSGFNLSFTVESVNSKGELPS